MSKKKCLMITIGSLAAVLIVYAVLGCLVYCYYEPNIEQEMSRQDGWNAAISEIEEEYRRLRAVQDKDFAAQKRQKERLRQAVKDEIVRCSHLQKDLLLRQ